MEFFVKLKHAESADPFRDPDDSLPKADGHRFEHDALDSQFVRGQIASYTAALTGCQFRTHAFSVLIFGRFARFIRWDRSGAVVSRKFDYSKHPDILADFFWRYSYLSPRQRGHDTSVSSTTLDEIQHVHLVEQRLRTGNPHHVTFCKIMVPDRDDPTQEKPFIISSPPKYTSRSPFGRATRPMLAFDMETKELVFLKDYWRTDVDGIEKEGDIYAILEQHEVPHIAPFGQGNDVRDHMTLTQTLRNETWACQSKEMVYLRQYRMSLDVVARPLKSFRSSWELVKAVADGMEGSQCFFADTFSNR